MYKYLFIFCSVLLLGQQAQAQQMGASDVGRAENAALAIQLKNQKEAMEQLQKNLEELTSKIVDPSIGLEKQMSQMKDDISNPSTGLKKKVEDIALNLPELAVATTYCKTRNGPACILKCNAQSINGRVIGSDFKRSHLVNENPRSTLSQQYSNLGTVKAIGGNVKSTEFVSGLTLYTAGGVEVGKAIDLRNGAISDDSSQAICHAAMTKTGSKCVKTERQCSGVGRGRTCSDVCVTYEPIYDYVETTCEAQCGAVGFPKK